MLHDRPRPVALGDGGSQRCHLAVQRRCFLIFEKARDFLKEEVGEHEAGYWYDESEKGEKSSGRPQDPRKSRKHGRHPLPCLTKSFSWSKKTNTHERGEGGLSPLSMAAAGINRSGSFFSGLRLDFARMKALAMASPGCFPVMAEWHPTCESLRHLKIPKPCSLLHATVFVVKFGILPDVACVRWYIW
jgi:hypothetical protein